MKCPACGSEMVEKDFGGVLVDVCDAGCKGIWFDWMELGKLDESNEGMGQALKEALEHPRANDENRGSINCPKCGVAMKQHRYKSSKEVNVDECYSCGGFFLDSGELKAIRDTFMTEEEEKEYLDRLVADSPALKVAEADQEKEVERGKSLRRYTRLMRLSYYLTGK